MNIRSRTLIATLVVTVVAGLGGQVRAQGPLAEARALYAAAAYEEALSVLAKLDSATVDRSEAEQYRALCLIALGRTADAERAIESVVSADPLFMPRAADVAPRVVGMFADVRRRILPEIARRAYLDGRRAFQVKDFAAATSQFNHALRVIDQTGVESGAELDDLKILLSGFVDLARAGTERSSLEVGEPRAATLPAAWRPQAPGPREDFTAPVAIQQELPPWKPPTAAVREWAYAGAIKILIGPDGRVQDASMVKPVHPLYDPLVLKAAQRWVYRPATRFGEPTVAEKVVEIRLAPR